MSRLVTDWRNSPGAFSKTGSIGTADELVPVVGAAGSVAGAGRGGLARPRRAASAAAGVAGGRLGHARPWPRLRERTAEQCRRRAAGRRGLLAPGPVGGGAGGPVRVSDPETPPRAGGPAAAGAELPVGDRLVEANGSPGTGRDGGPLRLGGVCPGVRDGRLSPGPRGIAGVHGSAVRLAGRGGSAGRGRADRVPARLSPRCCAGRTGGGTRRSADPVGPGAGVDLRSADD